MILNLGVLYCASLHLIIVYTIVNARLIVRYTGSDFAFYSDIYIINRTCLNVSL